VVELEALALGVTGKQALWNALRATVGESVDGVELGELSARAEDQRRRLEELRRRAVNEAFT
jgi:hypothetical protein